MRISDWSSDVCSSDLGHRPCARPMPPTPTPPLKGRGLNGTERSVTMLTEINFDGIIGPSHNYAGLSRGNIASARHAGDVSQPRAAAVEGIEKMRHNLAIGLPHDFFMTCDRHAAPWFDSQTTGCR